jgi:PAS domain S-box-containing protein
VERALRESIRDLREVEGQLRRSREEVDDFIENGPVPLHWIGPDGKIIWANRAELELLGYEKSEYIGRQIADFHVDRAVIDDILSRLANGETLYSREARLRCKDGSIRYVLISSNVYWQDGRFLHTRCFTRDITERKLADLRKEELAQRSERLLRITAAIADAVSPQQVFEAVVDQVAASLDATSAGLWLLEGDEPVVRLVRAVGYSAEQARRFDGIPLDGSVRFPAIDTIRTSEPMWIASQRDLLAQYPHLASASLVRNYRIATLPVVMNNRTAGALGFTLPEESIIEDNERSFLMLVARYSAQALERLRLSEEHREARLRAELLFRLAGSVIVAQTVDDVFVAALDTLGESLLTDRSAILVFDAEGVMRFRASRGLSERYRAAVEGHSPWNRDVKAPEPVVVSDVGTDPAWAAFLPLFQKEKIGALAFVPLVASGRLIGKFMAYFPSPRGFSAQELETAKAIAHHVASAIVRFGAVAELERAVRFHEMFTAILGHDLRNPLGAILATAEVGMRREESERTRKTLARIVNSGGRMARMIDQLLDFTRVRVGSGIPLTPKSGDLLPVLRQVIDELRIAHPGWTLDLAADGQLSGFWDEDRLAQVFSNLVANAIQHGVREHGVRLSADGTGSAVVCISVENAGAIPENVLPNLFEPMVTGERRRASSHGLGLGLFISRQIVQGHGGTIDVDSSVDAGTRFTVTLPRSTREPSRP